MRLHHKLHQEIPVNNELLVELWVAFARAFAYKYCKTTKEELNPEMYKVAWALAGAASVERCRKIGSLQQKMALFLSMVVDDAIVDSQ